MAPYLEQFVSGHKELHMVRYNVDNPGKDFVFANYLDKAQGIPQVYLLDQGGRVLTHWVGGYNSGEGIHYQLDRFLK